MRNLMNDILFCYARSHDKVLYKQVGFFFTKTDDGNIAVQL